MWNLLIATLLAWLPAVQAKPVIVVIETTRGNIEVAVDVAHAPLTGANFLAYVDAKLYDSGDFHRTVRPETETRQDYPIQVIQAEMNPARTAEKRQSIALERTSVTGLKHLDGTISMARGGPDTASDGFFICIGDQPALDFGGKRNADGQGFAAFGRVVAGMDVVKAIQAAAVAPNSQNIRPPIPIVKAYRKAMIVS
jgi:peptidyl-prolyl cis-trans isomerase A (cyclophilin A)